MAQEHSIKGLWNRFPIHCAMEIVKKNTAYVIILTFTQFVSSGKIRIIKIVN